MRGSSPGGLLRALVKVVCILAVGITAAQAQNQGTKATRHNLSSTNTVAGGANFTSSTDEVCVFCHTPHQANTGVQAPLWNKALPGTSYTTYNQTNSTTLDGQVLASVGSVSLACLSCHDGTQAMDNIINAPGSGGLDTTGGGPDGRAYAWGSSPRIDAGGAGRLTGVANLGGNLVDDHPIGIAYCGGGPNATAPGTACKDPDFVAPANGSVNGTQVFWVNTSGGTANREKTDMILYNRAEFTGGSGPSVECASCHDPHVAQGDTSSGGTAGATFLRISNSGSAVCLSCHVK